MEVRYTGVVTSVSPPFFKLRSRSVVYTVGGKERDARVAWRGRGRGRGRVIALLSGRTDAIIRNAAAPRRKRNAAVHRSRPSTASRPSSEETTPVDAQASSPFTALICRTAVLISTVRKVGGCGTAAARRLPTPLAREISFPPTSTHRGTQATAILRDPPPPATLPAKRTCKTRKPQQFHHPLGLPSLSFHLPLSLSFRFSRSAGVHSAARRTDARRRRRRRVTR